MKLPLKKPWERKRVGEHVVSGLGASWFYGIVTKVWPGEGTKGEDWLRIETICGLVVCTDHGNVYGVSS